METNGLSFSRQSYHWIVNAYIQDMMSHDIKLVVAG